MTSLPESLDLTGRVAIISGGAGLLGEEFCRTLAQAGASVVACLSERILAEPQGKSAS